MCDKLFDVKADFFLHEVCCIARCGYQISDAEIDIELEYLICKSVHGSH